MNNFHFSIRWLTWSILALSCLSARADLLQDLMIDKRYEPTYFSIAQQDSVLESLTEATSPAGMMLSDRVQLIESNRQPMFRHSYWADYRLYDTKKKDTILVGTHLRDVSSSPDKRYLVYAKGQDLYIYKVDYGTEVPITHDYQDGKDIFSGVSDWLYEEEFAHTQLYAFSPDSKQIALICLDETSVPSFEWQSFLPAEAKSSSSRSLYPTLHSIRYPKAGSANAQACVKVYDIFTKSVKTMTIGETEDWYIPVITWRTLPPKSSKEPSTQELVIEKINRDQTTMEVWTVNPKSGVGKLFYKEHSDKYYIDYALFESWQFLSDGRMIVLSEQNDWRQLSLLSKDGIQSKTLTPVGMDVTDVYGVDEKNGLVYYQAAPIPSERQAYSVSLKGGEPVQLTKQEGMHSLRFNTTLSKVIDAFQSDQVAPRYTLYSIKKGQWKEERCVFHNDAVTHAWKESVLPQKEFTTIPTERGDSLEAWIIYPTDFDAHQRYPVVMFQYSGPSSQRVLNRWRHRFAHYLASIGYIVVNADPRGSDCRGRAWRNATYMDLGSKEAEDHLSVAAYMRSLPYTDAARICMIGWSYGGYQVIRTMMEQSADDPLISKGVAIAPVTDWQLYDTGYTERYMRRPQVNEFGYRNANLIDKASDLSGELLLIHGTGDDNVHYQNTLLLMDALIQAGKQFDVQLYVDDNHSMRREANYEHLHRRIVRFLSMNQE